MAEQSLLAKLGLRLAVLGSAASLMIAAPLANGDPSMAAHTDATRIGFFASHATNNGILGVVVGGVETLDIQGDGAVTWIGIPTASQPALSPANKGSIYYDSTLQVFMASANGGAYAPFGGGGVSGLTAGRVVIAASATTVTDFANLTYSTAHGLNSKRGVGVNNTCFGLDAGNTTVTGIENTMVGETAGSTLSTGSDNTALGFQAAMILTTGQFNTAVGARALNVSQSGSSNTAVGYQSQLSITGGSRNTSLGASTLEEAAIGTDNVAVGFNCLNKIDVFGLGGSEMTMVGSRAGQNLNFQSLRCVGIGFQAISTSAGLVDMTAVGHNALQSAQTSCVNGTAVGSQALNAVTTGSNNTALGANAGALITTGVGNIFLGVGAGDSTAVNANSRLIIGSNTASVTAGYIGNGETNAVPSGFVLHGTGGSGANVGGASLTLAGGQGTGTGIGGSVILQTAPATGSSSTLNTLANRIVVLGTGMVGVNIDTPVSRLEIGGSYGGAILNINGDTTLDATHYTVLVDATGGNIIVTIPTAASATSTGIGRIYNIKRVDSSGNNVTIARSSADTFFTSTGGNTSITVLAGVSYMLQADTTNSRWVAL